MALDPSFLDADLGALLADLSESLTYPVGGASYVCNRVSLSARELQSRHSETVQNLRQTLAVQASDFATAPEEGETLTYGGETLRVLETLASPDGLELRLLCGEQYATG